MMTIVIMSLRVTSIKPIKRLPMSSSVKGRKEIGEKRKGVGRFGDFQEVLVGTRKIAFQKRQSFATPPESSAESSTLVEVRVIESEQWLLLQG
jgi:hypothetical protein